jgi:hypothetical protein
MDLMAAQELAIDGWTRYVLCETGQLPDTTPVDERMAQALSGIELPYWLEDGIRIRLVAFRGEALVRHVTARAGSRG